MTRTDAELAAAKALVEQLEQKRAQELQLAAQATENMRQLAIALHQQLCPFAHPTKECMWGTSPVDNDPNEANWQDAAHKTWLIRAQKGVQTLRDVGFLVTDPDEA